MFCAVGVQVHLAPVFAARCTWVHHMPYACQGALRRTTEIQSTRVADITRSDLVLGLIDLVNDKATNL